MNILITSAGRRVKVIQYFKREVDPIKGMIITADLDHNAPALYFSDFDYTVPEIYAENYISELLAICEEHHVSAVLALIDPELEVLAANAAAFTKKNITLIVSELEMVKMCFDKYEAYQFFQQNNLAAVPTFLSKEMIVQQINDEVLEFPLIAKPRKGSASEGIAYVKDRSELQKLDEYKGNLLFQPHYKEKEFGIDAYIDLLSGELVNLFIKEKLRMRSGETDKSISVHDQEIEALIIDLIAKTNFRGPIDIDVFQYKGRFYISEINPRFGGGYPHAYECGVNFPKYLLKNLQGLSNQPYSGFTYAEGKVMMKHDEILIR